MQKLFLFWVRNILTCINGFDSFFVMFTLKVVEWYVEECGREVVKPKTSKTVLDQCILPALDAPDFHAKRFLHVYAAIRVCVWR